MTDSGYSVIRYIPDAGRGESLNIGILVWAADDFALRIDEKAVARVIRENPRLETDALLYVEPMLKEKLSSAVRPVPMQIKGLLEEQKGFPVELTEPRLTNVDVREEGGLETTLERLTNRVVTPRRRSGQYRPSAADRLERQLEPLIKAKAITRHQRIEQTRTGVPRTADFFANSGAIVALDLVRLVYQSADRIRERADAEAFKVYDVLEATNASVREYFVFCEFGEAAELKSTNAIARKVIETQGATVVTDLQDAAGVLSIPPNK